MSDRLYRLLLGLTLLISLYFDLHQVLLAVIGLQLLEGISNFRIPLLINRARGTSGTDTYVNPDALIPFDAERAWRLTVAICLILSLLVFPEQLWWFAWFMGFAIFGAGLSGVCPMLIILQYARFR
ncbi:MAG: DUF2892 domain-containing protein [Gammaproteobacteria bacterium]|nr:DUF2892 domain-containing protein [Gammaproteobacteria bacterium]